MVMNRNKDADGTRNKWTNAPGRVPVIHSGLYEVHYRNEEEKMGLYIQWGIIGGMAVLAILIIILQRRKYAKWQGGF